ncbi:uncharacterized protein L969DRAFT_100567 [Mixia osmundae IAM 14324]|uniref:G domain-containing protein n=1 Tax=Mixia osmundae (strain CBS 9802 / IAM 14324 / JCM 22182 / KY 12970) TaxID=764103 RepID=G7DVD3_MIXOS|nr:uncharacterized protein L969DRAFT_100567 [Mixia osmundae IAM 14324]KEI42036.1 hypothetical protein L969DRAFT_100567 [Mixia osmundae IAM 14324]GAA94543.1 hypothetical protein E5Q_01195 [Mixia osmundae IAM 14324]
MFKASRLATRARHTASVQAPRQLARARSVCSGSFLSHQQSSIASSRAPFRPAGLGVLFALLLAGGFAASNGQSNIKSDIAVDRQGTLFKKDDVTVVFVLGGPKSGRSTQVQNIGKRFDAITLAAEDDLWADIAKELAANRGEKLRVVVDGFPGNLRDAQWFENEVCPILCFVYIDTPADKAAERGADPQSKARFDEEAKDLIAHYRHKGNFLEITGEWPADEVWEQVEAKLDSAFELEERGGRSGAQSLLIEGKGHREQTRAASVAVLPNMSRRVSSRKKSKAHPPEGLTLTLTCRMASYVPRSRFHFPVSVPSWYIGHMERGIRKMEATMASLDLVVEARDARLPITSVNTIFDSLVAGHSRSGTPRPTKGKRKSLPRRPAKPVAPVERLIVYTKADLADRMYENPLRRAVRLQTGREPLFADTRSDKDVKRILDTILQAASLRPAQSELTRTDLAKTNRAREIELPVGARRVLIAGMPNVGKSSLLNALRRVGMGKAKAAMTGPVAGVTRKLTGLVRVYEDPPIYVYDTPGIMVPFLGTGEQGAERAFKLALTAGINESLIDSESIADYLLYCLSLRFFGRSASPDLPPFLQTLTPPLPADDIEVVLSALASKTGALRKGGEPDLQQAAAAFIDAFRKGHMGPWTLDNLPRDRSGSVRGEDVNISELIRLLKAGGGKMAVPKAVQKRAAEEAIPLDESDEADVSKNQVRKAAKLQSDTERVERARKKKETSKKDAVTLSASAKTSRKMTRYHGLSKTERGKAAGRSAFVRSQQRRQNKQRRRA